MVRTPLAVLAIAVVTMLASCQKDAPAPAAPKPAVSAPAPAAVTGTTPATAPAPTGVSVAAISLGKALNSDRLVDAPLDAFDKADTVYLVVETRGDGDATLKAKWTRREGDKAVGVGDATEPVKTLGSARTVFQVGDLAAGAHEVEVFLDDKPAGAKKFTVR
jgi:hypothetical protein